MSSNDAIFVLSEIPIQQDDFMKKKTKYTDDIHRRLSDTLGVESHKRRLCFLSYGKISFRSYEQIIVLQYLSSNEPSKIKKYKKYLENVYNYFKHIRLYEEDKLIIDSLKDEKLKKWLNNYNKNITTNAEMPLKYLSESDSNKYIETFECEFDKYIFKFIPNRRAEDKQKFLSNIIDDIKVSGEKSYKFIVTNLGKEEDCNALRKLINYGKGLPFIAYDDEETGGYQFKLNPKLEDRIYNSAFLNYFSELDPTIKELRDIAEINKIPDPDSNININQYFRASLCKKFKVPFLLSGQTGVGKSYFANSIISESEKKNYKELNCATITGELFRSALFGHEKGAFTGATSNKEGLLTKFKDGIIFLDEIGEITLQDQAKLLKFIDNKTYTPIGSVESLTSNAYLIFASNRNLKDMCKEKKFRWDLYYRITKSIIKIPSFNDLFSGKKKIIIHEIEKSCNDYLYKNSKKTIISKNSSLKAPIYYKKKLGEDAIAFIIHEYDWPGNLREIYNTILKSFLYSKSFEISRAQFKQHLDITINNVPITPFNFHYKDIEGKNATTLLKAFKNRITKKSLDNNNGIKAKAARAIRLSPQTFDNWLKSIEKE